MMKFLLAAAALMIAAHAQAAEIRFPSEEPVATITIPDGWTVKEDDGALDVSSPGDSVYVGIEAIENAVAKLSMDAWASWMLEQGVKPDDATRKDSQGTIGGMSYTAIDSEGTDKDGRVSMFFATLQLSKTHQVLFIYWGAKDEQAPYLAALRMMMRSVRPLP
ncbi:hypothetical protein [Rhizobium sp.]